MRYVVSWTKQNRGVVAVELGKCSMRTWVHGMNGRDFPNNLVVHEREVSPELGLRSATQATSSSVTDHRVIQTSECKDGLPPSRSLSSALPVASGDSSQDRTRQRAHAAGTPGRLARQKKQPLCPRCGPLSIH